jgi:hypothetical protein
VRFLLAYCYSLLVHGSCIKPITAGIGTSHHFLDLSLSGETKVSATLIAQMVISGVTFFASMGGAMFIAGMRWGRIGEEISSIDRRLAKIEGMFTMVPKDLGTGQHVHHD